MESYIQMSFPFSLRGQIMVVKVLTKGGGKISNSTKLNKTQDQLEVLQNMMKLRILKFWMVNLFNSQLMRLNLCSKKFTPTNFNQIRSVRCHSILPQINPLI
jgi:hypothetical protein